MRGRGLRSLRSLESRPVAASSSFSALVSLACAPCLSPPPHAAQKYDSPLEPAGTRPRNVCRRTIVLCGQEFRTWFPARF